MNKLRIKESYLILLIIISLVSLGIYTTFALFTASTTISDVVGITTTLDIGKSMSEYEVVTVPAGETKLIELNVVNSYNNSIYYGAWYQIVQGNSDNIQIGLYTEKNSNPSSGVLTQNSNIKLLAGITNDNSTSIIVYIGVKGSLTNELNLDSSKALLPDGFSEALLVTDEVLEAHKVTTTETVNKTFSATGAVQNVTLNAGTYKLEVWGAQGGNYNTTYTGGKGGYSYGTLTLNNTTNLYVYVGKQAQTITTNRTVTTGGFNGGGNGFNRYYSGTYTYAQGGGGATDIRIGQDSLYSRVIVAGGGSGATNRTNGYYGGGTSGGTGLSGYAGSQTSAGTNGSFGTGGSATTSGNNYKYGSAGGGGGWYGGGASTSFGDGTNYDTYSGGGSGYVYTSSTASNYPSGNLLTSTYYLTNAATVVGNTSFTSTSGGTETGHSGDGYAKITGTGEVYSYTIPNLTGLTDLTVPLGTSISLTKGTTLTCENNTTTGCSITNISITDTSSLTEGTHVVTYTVKGTNNKKYLFNRNINILSDPAQATLTLLNLTLSTGSPDFSKASCSSGCGEATVGIYKIEDDIGTSYYFRGDVENNYVYFANKYWRIIRINGDGTIRMIYAGTSAHENGYNDSKTNDMSIRNSPFNSESNDNAYVGFMYGTLRASTYEATHANTNDSTIKKVLDTWYTNNIKNTPYDQYIADAIYCNDRSLDTTSSGTGAGTSTTDYGANYRLYDNKTPTLKCSQVNDRFTKSAAVSGVTGNGKLTNAIGLITADEVAYAGGLIYQSDGSAKNSKYYLYTNTYYLTMSSFNFYGSIAREFFVSSSGSLLDGEYVNDDEGGDGYVRPVISLSFGSLSKGTGTKNDPFKTK